MDYEKKQRLIALRDSMKSYGYIDGVEELDSIFPDLVEDEDERLRKAALEGIEYLEHNLAWDAIGDTDILDVKEYLEKQKDVRTIDDVAKEITKDRNSAITFLKNAGIMDENGELTEKYRTEEKKEQNASPLVQIVENNKAIVEDIRNGVPTKAIEGARGVKFATPIRKEQKSTEWNFPYGVNETVDKLIAIAECLEMDGDCSFNGYSGTECGKFLRELARKQIECEPVEWSEDDKQYLLICENAIDRYCWEEKWDAPTIRKWLNEHLLKQEWSEEDEENMDFIIEVVRGRKVGLSENRKQYYENFLKSLRPQSKEEREPMEIKYGGKIYQVHGVRAIPGGVTGYIIEDEPGHYDCIINPEEVLGGGYGVKQNGSPYPTKEATFDNPHWKPSEEQMEALKSCFHINPATGEPHSPSLDEIYMLGSLYNDLLKNCRK